jgi:hypothetical protein
MVSPAPQPTNPSPASWPTVARAVGLLTVIISVLLVAFAWPAARSSVHGVPIAVAGPAAAVNHVTITLDQRLPGGFTITKVSDAAHAERMIRDREVYGAIDVSTGSPRLLIASGGSPLVAQTLQGIAAALSPRQGNGPPVTVRDVAALPSGDPRGAGLAAGSLPLVLGGMIAAVLLTRLVRGRLRRTVGAFAYSVTGGLAMAAILQFWLGSVSGHYLANAGAVALTIAATSLTILGCESLFGYLGFSVGAIAMLVIGNPLSGASSAPEMLPGWSGAVGQLLPPGAGVHLLRSTAYFDGHGTGGSILVLLAWLAVGAVLSLIGHHRSRRVTPSVLLPENAAEPVALAKR